MNGLESLFLRYVVSFYYLPYSDRIPWNYVKARPPSISAHSCPIFKKLDSTVSYGAKELTCKISSKSVEKHGSYGSSKKIGTRDSSRIRDKEQKTQNGPNRIFSFQI